MDPYPLGIQQVREWRVQPLTYIIAIRDTALHLCDADAGGGGFELAQVHSL